MKNWHQAILLFLFCLCPITLTVKAQTTGKTPVDANGVPIESTPVDDAAAAKERESLPLIQEKPLPSVTALLEQETRDWVILIGDRVLEIPAISPRPNHLEWMINEQKKVYGNRPTDESLLPQWREEYRRFNSLIVEVEDNGLEEDYLLPTRYIQRILYHEDLMLLKANELIRQGELETAYQLISAVGKRAFTNNLKRKQQLLEPIEWPGLLDAERNLTVAEIEKSIGNKKWEAAFLKLDLHVDKDATFVLLPELASKILSALAEEILPERKYREFRYYLRRSEQRFPKLPAVAEGKQQLQSLAAELLQRAEQAGTEQRDREASLLAQQAVQIWPASGNFQRRWQALQLKYPVLRTGMLRYQTTVPDYQARLRHHQWLTISAIKQGYPRYHSRFLESWIPHDLGREIHFSLRQRYQPYESLPLITTFDLQESFLQLMETRTSATQQSGLYAETLLQYRQIDPLQFAITFREQIPHPLSWLAALSAHSENNESTIFVDSHFQPLDVAANHSVPVPEEVYVRSRLLPRNHPAIPVTEVQNFFFRDKRELLQAIMRDEIDYIPEVPLEYVDGLASDERFFLHQYQLPEVTALQWNFTGRLAKLPELRFALLSQLNRSDLLDEQIEAGRPAGLTTNARSYYQLTNSLAPRGSHAWHPAESVVPYDPIVGRALVSLLQKNPDFPQEIRLAVSDDPQSQQVAELIAFRWEQLGFHVQLLDMENSESRWDVRFVSRNMLAPLAELPALLTEDGSVSTEELLKMPASVRTQLLQLEQSQDWKQVNQILRDLQHELTLQCWFMPLWEKQRFGLVRREIQNLPKNIHEPCQGIDRWMIGLIVPRY